MVTFILTMLYIGLTLELCPFFWDIIDSGLFENPQFLYVSFLSSSLVNYFVIQWKETFNNNRDVLWKFLSFCLRAFSLFFVLLFSELKRLYFFLKKIKYKVFLKTCIDFLYLNWNKFFLIWKPLFKKWSYFGFYKTNRSKWWKNK